MIASTAFMDSSASAVEAAFPWCTTLLRRVLCASNDFQRWSFASRRSSSKSSLYKLFNCLLSDVGLYFRTSSLMNVAISSSLTLVSTASFTTTSVHTSHAVCAMTIAASGKSLLSSFAFWSNISNRCQCFTEADAETVELPLDLASAWTSLLASFLSMLTSRRPYATRGALRPPAGQGHRDGALPPPAPPRPPPGLLPRLVGLLRPGCAR